MFDILRPTKYEFDELRFHARRIHFAEPCAVVRPDPITDDILRHHWIALDVVRRQRRAPIGTMLVL